MRIFFLIFIFASLLLGETLRLTTGEWEPFTSSKDKTKSMCEEIVNEAFKLEDVDIVNKFYPWKRSLKMAEEATESDGTYPWQIIEKRKEKFLISDPIVTEKSVYFHLKSTNFEWDTISDLKRYKVGVTNGYSTEIFYKENGIEAEAVPKEELNFKKMLAGRIDVYAASFFVGYNMINKLYPEKANLFTNHKKPVSTNGYALIISKKHPKGKEIVSKFNSGLKKLKSSGRYEEILSKFSGM